MACDILICGLGDLESAQQLGTNEQPTNSIGIATNLVAGLWSIREGLKLLVQKNSAKVILKSDCMTAIQLLKKDEKNGMHEALIKDCRLYANRLPECKFRHVLPWNRYADFMASIGQHQHQHQQSLSVMERPPDGVLSHLKADLMRLASVFVIFHFLFFF
ncbi:hypothetical protein F0562_035671 [Nyssa sinensis]|uniref:RNase H type-1 domain-containing protein n=1 Tax=Nyssa sinensis TaxID=561372 RepID=A0A5J5AF46_9ASTE|nr:hypothetical protein F0562_035671 [Nyssa sinensis]